ncbi:Cmx/CmrA family chloramphenicol efflux MFS transporter [Amycolatopsis keratiniphila]|uniref:Cmx/CmrA family chloramphenicol efflux MFS transporter n=1 Tax=Amycolatopsis keratiniphila TaxID=129921 RepID=UPI00087AC53D|nr:Cmx/CmrA family chloramphenicol efflux MFS transporter [Amycolatopsis keratiniphila]OLZ49505.1 chemotaxis protein [Amycolatopsis keratiniphila subsp. nogabecina]SDU20472.1 MFS transporter, DHA1 family, chloramphenicol resistance protein [Amycolatopsis keratiniphila]
MPLAVCVLGLSVFALGTSEFMITGLLPGMAADLDVGIPEAGLLISAFAIGMVVGAPLLAIATLRVPRRATLMALLVVFGLSHVVGALGSGYALLFATRVVSAVACAGFWAVAAATAVALVPVERRGRALAILVGGLTVANIAGVPAGTFLGQHAGWRAAFWAVTALTVIALIGVFALVPETQNGEDKTDVATELRLYRGGRFWLALGVIALAQAMIFATFSYLAPLLTEVAGLPESWVPGVLSLFGLGALIGITAGGRLADARPFATLYGGLGVALVALILLALSGPATPLAIIAVFLFGVAGFGVNPALNVRAFAVAGNAPTLVGASTTAAFNVGNTVGPWLGGESIDAGLGYPSVAWVSVGLGVATVVALTFAAGVQRTDDTRLLREPVTQ